MSEGKEIKLSINGKVIGIATSSPFESVSYTPPAGTKPKPTPEPIKELPDAPPAGEEPKTAPIEGFKAVSKEDLGIFVKEFPARLDYDVTGIFDPPIASYNDLSGGKVWPDSVVAYVVLNEAHPSYKGHQNEYFIKTA